MPPGSRPDSLGDRKSPARGEPSLDALIERVPAIVYVSEMGTDGAWRYVSPRIEDLLGYSPKEWKDDPTLWIERLHPDDRQWVIREELEYERLPVPGTGSRVEYRMVRRDGTVIWVMDDATIEEGPDGVPLWHGVLHEITDRKQVEEALEALAKRQAGLADLGELAVSGEDPYSLMDKAIELIREDRAELGCIWEMVSGGGLRLKMGLDREGRSGLGRLTVDDESHLASAIRQMRPVMIDDWEAERRFSRPESLRRREIRSTLAVVIEGEESPYGLLEIHSTVPNTFDPADAHLAQSAANVLAGAIQRSAADERLRHRVLHDSLTGLPNRQLFMELLESALGAASEHDTPIAVLFLDLDHFKLINDSLGHHAGDDLLRVVAPRLVGRLRPADVVARFGGDEFGMLVTDLTDEQEAVAIAERIGRALARPITIDGTEHFVTASIGIAVIDPRSGKEADAESLIRDADAAMYKAKEMGRARHQLFGEEMRAQAVRRLEIQRRLRHAVDDGQLSIEYQPVVSLATGQAVGTEALLRWYDPERGVVMPQEFIPIAEESGLIGEIGRWVIATAVEQTVAWNELRPDERPLDIAVNISPRQVSQPGLPELVEGLLRRTGLDPSSLQLEITEGALLEESAMVRETLEGLNRLGVSLVLDDFGTGYSSLAYLSRFPLRSLKIDRSFVEKLDADGMSLEGTAIVEAIVAMADALSLDVIAEGVSDVRHVRRLSEMGCGYAQGYLFSAPLGAAKMTELLASPEQISAALRP